MQTAVLWGMGLGHIQRGRGAKRAIQRMAWSLNGFTTANKGQTCSGKHHMQTSTYRRPHHRPCGTTLPNHTPLVTSMLERPNTSGMAYRPMCRFWTPHDAKLSTGLFHRRHFTSRDVLVRGGGGGLIRRTHPTRPNHPPTHPPKTKRVFLFVPCNLDSPTEYPHPPKNMIVHTHLRVVLSVWPTGSGGMDRWI